MAIPKQPYTPQVYVLHFIILLNDIWTCSASDSQLRFPAILLRYLHSQETTQPCDRRTPPAPEKH